MSYTAYLVTVVLARTEIKTVEQVFLHLFHWQGNR